MEIITKLPLFVNENKETAIKLGLKVDENFIYGTDKQIEAYLRYQNPMFQAKYNNILKGRWNALTKTLDSHLPITVTEAVTPIYMSVSTVQSEKATSTGFYPIVYATLEELAESMHTYAHTSAIFNRHNRYNQYTKQWELDGRRRQHNIAFIGNTLVYDFDNGQLSFSQAKDISMQILQEMGYPSLIIKSKSDPKYDYDRFKLVIRTTAIFPIHKGDNGCPDGFEVVKPHPVDPFKEYKDVYIGFAEKFKFWDKADQSTKTPERLIAKVTNTDDERREYAVIA